MPSGATTTPSFRRRDQSRIRRKRVLVVLVLIAVATLVVAWRRQSLNWLLLHIALGACLAWYVAMLSQVKQKHAEELARHDGVRQWDESPVRVVSER